MYEARWPNTVSGADGGTVSQNTCLCGPCHLTEAHGWLDTHKVLSCAVCLKGTRVVCRQEEAAMGIVVVEAIRGCHFEKILEPARESSLGWKWLVGGPWGGME